ncbi:MAG TPA: hydantoinase B/oxoprolinase family protein, partial [Chloroflexota bacterium]|nr:hydantoinase B/oxoprolinase family protein [Chloroflexota bacterium]
MTLDPITLEVINNRLREIGATMSHILFHSGYSTILRESRDGSAGICNAQAEAVIAEGTPIHLYPYHKSTQAVLEAYGADALEEGDSFMLTDPYEAGTAHLPDLVIVTPVFVEGQVFAFSVSIAHKPDLGGLVPGSSSPGAREIYHEGLLVPPVRYWTRDGVVREVEAIVKRNSRVPETIAGDIRAQVGCTRIGAERIVELCREYDPETIQQAMSELLRLTDKRIRDGLRQWPDGEAEAEGWVDDDGVDRDKPVRLHVRIAKRGDELTIDFSDSSEQAKGPINLGPAVSEAGSLVAVLTSLDPTIPVNDGARRAINF